MVSAVLKIFPTVLAASLVWGLVKRFLLPHPFDKIPGPPPKFFIPGHLPQIFAPDGWDFHRSLADNYGRVIKLYGLFKERMLYTYDPKAMYHMFIKDQHTFEESVAFISANRAIFGDGLLSTMGDHHKKQRKMLNPVFSIVHMRKMIPTFFGVSYKLRDVLLRKTADGPQEIDMVSWMTRAALEIVGLAALGQSFDPITEEHDEHPYITSMKLLGPLARPLMILRQYVLPFVYKYNIGTPRLRRWATSLVPLKPLHQMVECVDVMHETSVTIFNARKKAIEDAGGSDEDGEEKRDDFLSILMRENAKASEEDRLPDSEVIAQISTFMFAGMDTTSSALARFLWLLAQHQDVQDKLRAEIRKAKEEFGGEPDYDQLSSLPYLDAVCRESLRLHPPIAALAREAHKDAFLPFSKPIKTVDGKEIDEVFVPKDTLVIVSIKAANTNPEVWGPDAHEWKPERWLSPLPESLTSAKIPGVYSHLMTFIGGGRACIGFKFSEMEMKVILFVLIDIFKFSLPKQEIIWNMVGIATPCVDINEIRPCMPLVVARAD